jgi:hypothetical protein
MGFGSWYYNANRSLIRDSSCDLGFGSTGNTGFGGTNNTTNTGLFGGNAGGFGGSGGTSNMLYRVLDALFDSILFEAA